MLVKKVKRALPKVGHFKLFGIMFVIFFHHLLDENNPIQRIPIYMFQILIALHVFAIIFSFKPLFNIHKKFPRLQCNAAVKSSSSSKSGIIIILIYQNQIATYLTDNCLYYLYRQRQL